MNTFEKIAVVGATGRLGTQLVEVLHGRGDEVVAISRSAGVDVVTGDGLVDALSGVDCVIDVATQPSPDEGPARAFFTASVRNLQEAGEQAGVRGIVLVSIIGVDRSTGGYYAAKLAQERELAAGSIPVQIVRATQFHEFLGEIVEWGRQGDVVYVPKMRTQPVAARSLAEALAGAIEDPEASGSIREIGGPREERFADIARLILSSRGDTSRIEEVTNPDDPHRELFESGALLPGPNAVLVGPTFEEWLRGRGSQVHQAA
jgi:uncharacterized protein YbjT (DUF2867 family)